MEHPNLSGKDRGQSENREGQSKLRVRAVSEPGIRLPISVELVLTGTCDARASEKVPPKPLRFGHKHTRDGFAIFSLNACPPDPRGANSPSASPRGRLTYVLDQNATAAGQPLFQLTLPEGPWLELKATGRWHDDGLEADDVRAIPGLFPELGDSSSATILSGG